MAGFRLKMATQHGEKVVEEFGFNQFPVKPREIAKARDILHCWTSIGTTVDFAALKEKFTNKEAVEFFGNIGSKNMTEKQAKDLISGIVDLLEFSFVAYPFRRINEVICEQARSKVLAKSLEQVKPKGEIERLILASWLSDIDSNLGKDSLTVALKGLPSAPFLRINVAAHLLSRVHWNHAKAEDRLNLLDAAEAAIKPLALNLNKGELIRMIERTAKEGSEDDEAEFSRRP